MRLCSTHQRQVVAKAPPIKEQLQIEEKKTKLTRDLIYKGKPVPSTTTNKPKPATNKGLRVSESTKKRIEKAEEAERIKKVEKVDKVEPDKRSSNFRSTRTAPEVKTRESRTEQKTAPKPEVRKKPEPAADKKPRNNPRGATKKPSKPSLNWGDSKKRKREDGDALWIDKYKPEDKVHLRQTFINFRRACAYRQKNMSRLSKL
jgi:hypothetical protein